MAADRSDNVVPFPDRRPRRPEPLLREMLGEVLRHERQAQRRTLRDVADEAGVSLPYLSEIERGRKEGSSELIASVGAALELSVRDLLSRAAESVRPTDASLRAA